MKRLMTIVVAGAYLSSATSCKNAAGESDLLRFDPDKNGIEKIIELADGKTVKCRAYENIYYVANVVDSAYQYLNLYIPESAYDHHEKVPVFLKTNVGGYRAAKAGTPSAKDATGRALQEGYIVVIPGSRGSNSQILTDNGEVYTGKAPAGLIDLKAAIRYLRYNHAVLPGDTDCIITDGTSAGGAMSALLGATGNHPVYEPFLEELGAASEQDDIFAAVCFCPITDLDHADMAYEWLYQGTNTKGRALTPEQIEISDELAALYPAYLNSLQLKTPDGTLLTDSNYREYVKSFLIASARRAKNAGAEIPEDAGFIFDMDAHSSQKENITGLDLDTYLEYVVSKQVLKIPPAFDAMNVLSSRATPENEVFGDQSGNAANFTDFSLQKATNNLNATLDPSIKEKVHIMNPMYYIGDSKSTTAPNWYIRHGAIDRDTGFPVPINLYTRLINQGYNADFELAWNKAHTGDYDLDNLFEWLNELIKNTR